MRKVSGFEVAGAESGLEIATVDEPGAGGAYHAYLVTGSLDRKNPSFSAIAPYKGTAILFQNGGLKETDGPNGLTNEVLLAIVKDRLECFQAGPFPTQENATALQNVNEALRALHKRTEARLRRGVEGKSVA